MNKLHATSRLFTALGIVLLVLLAGTRSVLGSSTDPTDARGFAADQMYHFQGIDSINSYNGNLVLTVPIGGKYTVGDSLTYSFTLSYNSNIWDHKLRGGAPPFSISDSIDLPDQNLIESVPHPFNAGMGWLVTFGALGPGPIFPDEASQGQPWYYYTPDGAEHTLYATLHDSDFNLATSGVTTAFTRDSTYFRMTVNGDNTLRTVAMPDGTRQEFACGTTCNSSLPKWQLTRMIGPRNDVLNFAYGPSDTTSGSMWTITEGDPLHPIRTHYVRFALSPPYGEVISEIDLAAFNGARAKYTFTYANARILRDPESTEFDPSTLEIPFNSDGTITVPQLTTITMPAPDSGHGTGAEQWTFKYIDTPGSGPGDYVPVPPPPANAWRPYPGSLKMGRLNEIGLPAGGAVHYEYGRYRFPRRNCDDATRNQAEHPGLHMPSPRWSTTVGVKERQELVRDTSGNLVAEEQPTFYFSDVNIPQDTYPPDFCGAILHPDDFTNIRVDPDGTITKLYFSAFLGTDSVNGFDPFDYGLPFSKLKADPTQAATTPANQRRYISTEVYDCSAAVTGQLRFLGEDDSVYWSERDAVTAAINNPPPVDGCRKVRSTYVRFERSGKDCNFQDFADGTCAASNRRLASQATVYEDEGATIAGNPVFKTEDYGDFDYVGHFRRVMTSGTFARENNAGSDQRTVTTSYNPGLGITSPFGTIPWLLDTYSYKLVETVGNYGAQSALTSFQWSNGFMTQSRTHNGGALVNGLPPAANAADVVVDYDRVAAANPLTDAIVVTETHSGGDPDAIHGQRKQYVLQKQYRFGALARTEYRSGTSTFLLTGATNVDQNSGLPQLDYDASSATTAYTFDARGRITSVTPPFNLDPTNYVYRAWSSANRAARANVSVQRDSASSTDQLTTYFFDGLGRIRTITNRTAPDGAFSGSTPPGGYKTTAKFIDYGPMGRKAHESILQSVNVTSPATEPQDRPVWRLEYLNYDAFGRPGRIVQWQGGNRTNKETDYEYAGERYVKETIRPISAAGDGGNGGTNGGSEYKVSERDVFGRIVRVDDQSQNPGVQSTFYDYDVFDNIARVQQNTPSARQSRLFIHDSRNFLVSTTLPELGSGGGGSLSYSGIDVMGHATHQKYGSGSPQDLFFEFDAAGRPLNVMSANASYGLGGLLKQYSYFAGSTAACDSSDCGFSGGKVEFAIRHNYLPLPDGTGNPTDVVVQEHYRYIAAGGKVSEIETKITRGAQSTPENVFRTAFSYDGLGNIATVAYPTCTACGAGVPALQTRQRYVYGQLKNVDDGSGIATYATNLTYAPSGLLATVVHGNGVTDTWQDEDGIGRPNSITVAKGTQQLWASGIYAYDGAGNITRIGADQYAYDTVNRLVWGRVSGVDRKYRYDRWGNITNFNLGSGPLGYEMTVPLDPASNHIAAANGNRVQYDAAGNLTMWKDLRETSPSQQWATSYTYDGTNSLTHVEGPGLSKSFVYDATDQRAGVIDYRSPVPGAAAGTPPTTLETWSLRGTSNEVLRDFTAAVNPNDASQRIWNQKKDYVYRGASLLTSLFSGSNAQGNHYHLDHLGTPRVITNSSGAVVARRTLLPFGEELAPLDTTDRMKFTGHERDQNNPVTDDPLGNLDYMHARYYNPMLGRFLSVDSHQADAGRPLSWNRYVYSSDNPLARIDPDGKRDVLVAIWSAKAPYVLGGGSVGHAAAFETNGKVLLNQFPAPHGHKGKNDKPETYEATKAKEGGRSPDHVYKVNVPNDAAFDGVVSQKTYPNTPVWDFLPTNVSQTNCVEAVGSALEAGGVPVQSMMGGLLLLPADLEHALWDLSAEKDSGVQEVNPLILEPDQDAEQNTHFQTMMDFDPIPPYQ